ncbi:hypothetical protein AKO1_006211 [Acrasis kona]|uniref:Guanylate cyclase domain-containing protein n=1 Tax=Acrasis kona TaxID=1008807 RepID=A0AAW2YH33_9EUKA
MMEESKGKKQFSIMEHVLGKDNAKRPKTEKERTFDQVKKHYDECVELYEKAPLFMETAFYMAKAEMARSINPADDQLISLYKNAEMSAKYHGLGFLRGIIMSRMVTLTKSSSLDDPVLVEQVFSHWSEIGAKRLCASLIDNYSALLRTPISSQKTIYENDKIFEDALMMNVHENGSRFAPTRQLLKQLGKDKSSDLQSGDCVMDDMAVICIGVANIKDIMQDKSASDMIHILGQFACSIMQSVESQNGFVERIYGQYAQTHAFFPGGTVDAVRASENVIKSLLELKIKIGKPIAINVGLCAGKVILGAVDCGYKLDTVVISDAQHKSALMQKLATLIGCDVLSHHSMLGSSMVNNVLLKVVLCTDKKSVLYIVDPTNAPLERAKLEFINAVNDMFCTKKFDQFYDVCCKINVAQAHESYVVYFKNVCNMYRNLELPENWCGEILVDHDANPIPIGSVKQLAQDSKTSLHKRQSTNLSQFETHKQAPTNDGSNDDLTVNNDDFYGSRTFSEDPNWEAQNEIRELRALLSQKDKRIESLLDKVLSTQLENDELRKQLMSSHIMDNGRRRSSSSNASSSIMSCLCLPSPNRIKPS